MNKQERAEYLYKNRALAPYQRREKATLKMEQAMALLEDEIKMQDAYRSMDYGSLRTGHYKWAVKLLTAAIEAMEKEQDEYVFKILHKEWRTTND